MRSIVAWIAFQGELSNRKGKRVARRGTDHNDPRQVSGSALSGRRCAGGWREESTLSRLLRNGSYIIVWYGNGAKSPQPKPAMLAAVLQGCTSMLGSGRVEIGAGVTAILSYVWYGAVVKGWL